METLNTISAERLNYLHQLYKVDCTNRGLRGSISDFIIWLNEGGYVDED
jgi:hypothetical protein